MTDVVFPTYRPPAASRVFELRSFPARAQGQFSMSHMSATSCMLGTRIFPDPDSSGSLASNSALTGLASIGLTGALSLSQGASVTADGNLVNNGSLGIKGSAGGAGPSAAMFIDGVLSGTGVVGIDDGGHLTLGQSATGDTIFFAGSGGAVKLATGSALGALVAGFANGDSVVGSVVGGNISDSGIVNINRSGGAGGSDCRSRAR
jgi:hypothetical protein